MRGGRMLDIINLYRNSGAVDKSALVDVINSTVDKIASIIEPVRLSLNAQSWFVSNQVEYFADQHFLLTDELRIDTQQLSSLPAITPNTSMLQSEIKYTLSSPVLVVFESTGSTVKVNDQEYLIEGRKAMYVESGTVSAPRSDVESGKLTIQFYDVRFAPFIRIKALSILPVDDDGFETIIEEQTPVSITQTSDTEVKYKRIAENTSSIDFPADHTLDVMRQRIIGGRDTNAPISFQKYTYVFDDQLKQYVRKTYAFDSSGFLATVDDAQNCQQLNIPITQKDVLTKAVEIPIAERFYAFDEIQVDLFGSSQSVLSLKQPVDVITANTLFTDGTGEYSIAERASGAFIVITYDGENIDQHYFQSIENFAGIQSGGTFKQAFLICDITPEVLHPANSSLKQIDYQAAQMFIIGMQGVLNIKVPAENASYYVTETENIYSKALQPDRQHTFVITNNQDAEQAFVAVSVYYKRQKIQNVAQHRGFNYEVKVMDGSTNVTGLYHINVEKEQSHQTFTIELVQSDRFYLSHNIVISQWYQDLQNGTPVFDIAAPQKRIFVQTIKLKPQVLVEVD